MTTEIILQPSGRDILLAPLGALGAATLLSRLRTVGVVVGARELTNNTGGIIPYGAVCTVTGGVVDFAHGISQAEADCACICVQPGGVANLASGLFAFSPCIVEGLTGGIAGALAFVSDDIPGEILPAPPFIGNWIKVVGRWISSTVLAFEVSSVAPNQREA